jgi:hypothetical protein
MKAINLTPGSEKNVLVYNHIESIFYGSERDIPFDTQYEVKNTSTGVSYVFEFSHSTGPEFDIKTQWIYTNEATGRKIIISNDERITKRQAKMYSAAKTGNR